MEKMSGGRFLVSFCDYGNQDVVAPTDIVPSSKHIPDGSSSVDINVNQEEELVEEPRQVTLKEKAQDVAHLISSGSSMTVTIPNDQHHHTRQVSAPAPDDSSDLKCSLCSRCPPRMPHKLACDSSPLCWGCGIKRINVDHICWVCNAR